ncbi:MAG: S9 family peptidase [Bdellovibrionaceae bacterium]|nr:S9 family peptidase [Pseudobdellovibrionaceae bacterium]
MKNPVPPRAPQKETRLEKHGDVRIDPYFWLRDKENPETMKYLEAENKYYEQILAPLKKTREKLFKEMKSRIREDDSTPPAPWGEFEYYNKFKKGQQYALHCRRPRAGARKKEQVLLDENQLAKGKKYFSLGTFSVSPRQDLIAYSVDFDGSEKYTLRFHDIARKKDFDARIPNTSGSVVWANDNQTVFYCIQDEKQRPYRVYRHKIGQPSSEDELIFEEKSPEFFLGLSKSSSDQYIFIGTHAKTSSEVLYIHADHPALPPKLIEARAAELEYDVEHHGDFFYIHTNEGGATNFKISRAPVDQPGRAHWKPFWAEKKKILLTGMLPFKNWFVLFERENANPQIRVVSMPGKKAHLVKFNEPIYSAGPDTNLEYDTDVLRVHYSSMVQPTTVYDYNMKSRRKTVRKEQKVPGYKAAKYKCERLWVKGHDGAKIPLSVVYKKGLRKNGQAPMYISAYGSYGSSRPTTFSSLRLSLLDRGFAYAIAHIRGGQEMGRQWYEDGKFLKKKNTFHDLISCAEFLVKKKWTNPARIAVAGGSAGGMLMGAIMNMRPDLFKVVAAHVPFVDVLNTMLDETLPLTPMEYNEWGNPNDKTYYDYIKSYSPYDNVRTQEYPHLLVTAGISDPRVTYWEPAKWVNRLRELKTDSNLIVFKTNMGGGHFGASGRFEILKEYADEFAYILWLMGIKG